jgi:hypothetical protein
LARLWSACDIHYGENRNNNRKALTAAQNQRGPRAASPRSAAAKNLFSRQDAEIAKKTW